MAIDTGSADRVRGAGIVVTGGGAGIGRALALGLAAAGGRVVVNDLDAEAAAAVAARAGGYAVPGDAATEQGVHELIAAARKHLGEIDIYCSNAGIAAGTGPDTPDPVWQRAWEVNVMAHVRASRELLPAWLERGRGCFIVTASAAGLLTMLGSAPYSVTKHAAEGYAEWLAATYGHRGLVVHCICPQGVRTNMLADLGPGRAGGAAGRRDRARAGRRRAARGHRGGPVPHPAASRGPRVLRAAGQRHRQVAARDEPDAAADRRGGASMQGEAGGTR